MIQRRRWHKPGRVVVDSAAPATTYAISRSPFGRPRSLLPRPGWAVPFGRAHLSAPPRVLVKGSWSSIQPPRAEAVAVAAILPRLVHPPGRSRISREYSQDGHLLDPRRCLKSPVSASVGVVGACAYDCDCGCVNVSGSVCDVCAWAWLCTVVVAVVAVAAAEDEDEDEACARCSRHGPLPLDRSSMISSSPSSTTHHPPCPIGRSSWSSSRTRELRRG